MKRISGISGGNNGLLLLSFVIKSQLIMITVCASLKSLLSRVAMHGSFYKTVDFFKRIEAEPSHLQKQKLINSFRNDFSEVDLREFDSLMTHINKKVKIGITTKVVHNYYLKKNVSPHEHAAMLLQFAEGGLAKKLCKNDSESELTLYDVNLFLRYIVGVSGTGSQAEKSQKIIDVVSAVSTIEGIYFLKLIDHKITIGAKEKTFRNAKKSKAKTQEKQEKSQGNDEKQA